MDYFNSSVDPSGALVSTRRGLPVTRHKHGDLSFINASLPAPAEREEEKRQRQRQQEEAGRQQETGTQLPVRSGGNRTRPEKPTSFSFMPVTGPGLMPTRRAKRGRGAARGAARGTASRTRTWRDNSVQRQDGTESEATAASSSPESGSDWPQTLGPKSETGAALAPPCTTPETELPGHNRRRGPSRLRASLPARALFEDDEPAQLRHWTWQEAMPGHQAPWPPGLATTSIPAQISMTQHRQLERAVVICQALSYPLDKHQILAYQPIVDRANSGWIVRSDFVFAVAMMPGAAFEAALGGRPETAALLQLHSKVCEMFRTRIQQTGPRTRVPKTGIGTDWGNMNELWDDLIVGASVLALTSTLRCSEAEWRTHVKGLQQLIDAAGGLDWLKPSTLDFVRMIDTEGAVAAGTRPLLPFGRRRTPLSPMLTEPAKTETAISVRARSRLHTCGVDGRVVDTLTAVFILFRNLHNERSHATALKYDPHVLMEEIWTLKYQLLVQPRSLKASAAGAGAGGREYDSAVPDHDAGVGNSERESSMSDHDTPSSAESSVSSPLPSPSLGRPQARRAHSGSFTRSLESALRITTLSYLSEPLLRLPTANRQPPRLWSILVSELQVLLRCLGDMPKHQGPERDDDDDLLASARPLLLWLCVLGHVFLERNNMPYAGWSHHTPGKSLYYRILREVLEAPGSSAMADEMRADDDVTLVEEMSYVAGGRLDVIGVLGRMVKAGEGGQPELTSLPPEMRDAS